MRATGRTVGTPQLVDGRRGGSHPVILAGILTAGNFLCGILAILAASQRKYNQAAQVVGIAMIFDLLDGRVARLTRSPTDFGRELDSFADIVSFGVAPAILVLVWGFSALPPGLALLTAFTFAFCGAMRLARFNLQTGDSKNSVGLSIPAAGGTIAAIVHAFVIPITTTAGAVVLGATVLTLAFLMISTVHYWSLKSLEPDGTLQWSVTITGIAVAAILAYHYSRWMLLAIAGAYVSSGVLLWLRPRERGNTAAPTGGPPIG